MTQRYEIHLFADSRQFLLQDDHPAALDAIAVDTAKHGEIAVTVELHEARPDIDPAQWEKVDTAFLRIDSTRLVVASSTEFFPEAFRIAMRRGDYEALICHGDQRYLVALYPPIADAANDGILRVTRLAASHVTRYRTLMLRGYAEAPDAFTSTPEERAGEPESWWLKRIADPAQESVAFGCFDGRALVGTVTVEFSSKPKTRHKAHLIGMFVTPEARGRGAARMLVDAALELCKSREGVTSVTLTVTDGNEPAIALYSSVGFRSFGVEPRALRTSDGYLSKVHMQLSLREDV
jgi:ribosomal protein S18 acetylase RimI-like enzyme